MAMRWRTVRLPEDLASRLDRLAAETERAHREGRITLPSEHADRVPLWLAIERALDEVEARRVRSRKPRGRKTEVIP
jgi:predicted transcriptional regulator